MNGLLSVLRPGIPCNGLLSHYKTYAIRHTHKKSPFRPVGVLLGSGCLVVPRVVLRLTAPMLSGCAIYSDGTATAGASTNGTDGYLAVHRLGLNGQGNRLRVQIRLHQAAHGVARAE